MIRIELVFGLKRMGRPAITADEWQIFLEIEVTPRFPQGFTVLSGYGQFRNSTGLIARDDIKLLLVWHDGERREDNNIEAIRQSFCHRFGVEAVLRARSRGFISI